MVPSMNLNRWIILCLAAAMPGLAGAAGTTITTTTAEAIELAFDGAATRTLAWREQATPRWNTLENVLETTYNLVNLQPQTSYQIAVNDGQATQTLEGHTSAWEPQHLDVPGLGQLSWSRLQHLDTFTDGVWYPTVEYHDGRLYLVEFAKGEIHLNVMDAATSAVVTSTTLVHQPFTDRSSYLGIMDTVIHEGKLWVLYNEQDTNNPGGYHIRMSRERVLSYDLKTGSVGPTIAVEPLNTDHGTWEGGIDVLNGQMWICWLETRMEGDKRRTQIVLRPFDGTGFGKPIVYDNCPTPYPYGISISPWKDRLLVLFSDLVPYETNRNKEPLYYALFDGTTFTQARKIYDVGRNRYAKGVQMGDRFVLTWKSNAHWWSAFRYKYHDILLGVLDPETGRMDTTTMVGDRKYNSSPDMSLIAPGRAVVVFGKFEHEYNRADPAFNFGGYIGEVYLEK